MKTLTAITGAALLLVSQALAGPEMPIEQALKIATDYLREAGLAKEHTITSLALESGSLLKKDLRWVAQFSPAIDRGERKETGLQISPNGDVARIVSQTVRERTQDTSKRGARAMR